MTLAIIAVAASYLLGSVSFSIIIARLLGQIDIRQHGSGNAGATNTLRVLGKGPGIAVFLLDIAKGVIAVLLGFAFKDDSGAWVPVLCALASIVGHNWPIFFRFKGGKGIATTVGAMVALVPLPVVIAGVVAILIIVATRYVSLGSIIFAVLLPVILAVGGWTSAYVWGAVAVAVLAVLRHRRNIVKLLNGTENKLGGSKKEEPHGV